MTHCRLDGCGHLDGSDPVSNNVDNPRVVARQLAESILRSHEIMNANAPRKMALTDLRKIADSLDVNITIKPIGRPGEFAGALWPRESNEPSLFGDYEAEVEDLRPSGRFILAHEIGHRAASIYLGDDKFSLWPARVRRDFLDEFATRLILPDYLLRELLKGLSSAKLSIEWIEVTRQKVGTSISCLLRRLNDLGREGNVHILNCAFTAFPALSRRKRIDYALRTFSVCTPADWFIPSNKRVTSLGMNNLNRAYWNSHDFTKGVLEDNIMIIRRVTWQPIMISRIIDYKIYSSRSIRANCILVVF